MRSDPKSKPNMRTFIVGGPDVGEIELHVAPYRNAPVSTFDITPPKLA